MSNVKRPVKGAVQTTGSSTVNRYSSRVGPRRVNRSVRIMSGLDPRNDARPLKLVVSTTRVSPSQRPCELPSHEVSCGPSFGRGVVGTTRVSWIISFWIATKPGPWKICRPLL